MTEKGMQEEAMAETVRLHQDAEQARANTDWHVAKCASGITIGSLETT